MADIPKSYTSAETVAAMQAEAAKGAGDYKALVCIFLYGGADTHNLLVPGAGNPNRAKYDAARAAGVRVETSEMRPLGPGYGDWALHPSMTALSSFALSNTNASVSPGLAFVRSVGTLDRPTDKALYLGSPKARPDQLFAHNVQTDIWQAVDIPDTPRTTGWFGRAANLMDPYYNASQRVGLSVISASGAPLQGFANGLGRQSSVPPTQWPTPVGYGALSAATLQMYLDEINERVSYYDLRVNSNLAMSLASDIYGAYAFNRNAAINAQAALANATTGLVNFSTQNTYYTFEDDTYYPSTDFDSIMADIGTGSGSTNPIRNPLKEVARAILSRSSDRLSQRRQMFFVGFGGWDDHSNLRANQDKRLKHLDNALRAFWRFLDAYGLRNNVTVFTESEFSRTLQSNGTAGTDHGWAGHHIVMGGAVNSGSYGPEPDYTINGPRDTGLGRFIPDVSTEQYYATLLKWFGIPTAQLPLVLPNLGAYPSSNLGFMK